MPDGHLGYAIPIGGVVAYEDTISPSGVGFDIGCGVMAVNTRDFVGKDWPRTPRRSRPRSNARSLPESVVRTLTRLTRPCFTMSVGRISPERFVD